MKVIDEVEVGSDDYLKSLSGEILDALGEISLEAKSKASSPLSINPLANTQTFTGTTAQNNLSRSNSELRQGYNRLQYEPAIARIIYECVGGSQHVLFISRTMTVSGLSGLDMASHRSPVGSLASLDVGDFKEIEIAGEKQELTLIEISLLHPKHESEGWDAKETIFKHEKAATKTISSLRRLLSAVQTDGEDFDSWFEHEEIHDVVVEGVAHQIRRAMGLRDQPILDKFQDDIYRLPLSSQLFIAGPPGTGKTTTLIKRLGQKLDKEYLDKVELNQIGKVNSTIPYEQSWLMFTPTDLLRHYVKEAFSKEKVVSSDEHIKTWEVVRRELARNVFGLLQSSSNKGKFILKVESQFLKPEYENQPHEWIVEVERYCNKQYFGTLNITVEELQELLVEDQLLAPIKTALDVNSNLDSVLSSIHVASTKIESLITEHNGKAEKRAKDAVNSLFKKDREVFSRLAVLLNELVKEGDVADEEEVDDEVDSVKNTVKYTPQSAAKELIRLFKTIGRARYSNRSVSKKSKAGKVVEFLGDLSPDINTFKLIGESALVVTLLRRLGRAHNNFLLDVARIYKRFRKERSVFYQDSVNSQHISAIEIDLIILITLKNSHSLLSINHIRLALDESKYNYLAIIYSQFRHQVLVDEATDFSTTQLACMQLLAFPETKSFFACGDFNQRITNYGINSRTELEYLPLAMTYKMINTVYRQSKKLNHLSRVLLVSFGGDESTAGDIPNDLNHLGVDPVLIEGISGDAAISKWLVERITEIDNTIKPLPTIGILVGKEEQVQPLTNSLSIALEDLNIEAEACLGGKSLGVKSGVRVFSTEYIKGLEFEAVFFISIDKLADNIPELFEKYVYVGVTRAATYLGLTCEQLLPIQLQGVKGMFTDTWKINAPD
jgi:hypothetical protein